MVFQEVFHDKLKLTLIILIQFVTGTIQVTPSHHLQAPVINRLQGLFRFSGDEMATVYFPRVTILANFISDYQLN